MYNRKVAAAVIAALAGTSVAMAADQAPAAADQGGQDQILQEITVTGSLIPVTPDQVAVPVSTVDAGQIAQSGVASNALDILRKTIPAFEGRSNTGSSNANNNNQNTAGGSQAQLRNLPTLVLVNGRRVANSGIGAFNGKNFVDVNQIPADAIDHVEVLTDGASSIYGSDAIGGVVNFVLKNDFQGLEGGARAGFAQDYGERSAHLTAGTRIGDANVMATISLSHNDPLFQKDRAFTNPFYLGNANAVPGVLSSAGVPYLLNSALTSPSQNNPTGTSATAATPAALAAGTYVPYNNAGQIGQTYNLSGYQTLLLRENLGSFVSSFDMPVLDNNRLTAFGDLMLSQSKGWTQWLPANASVAVPAGAPYNPLTTATTVNFTDSSLPRQFYDTNTATRVTLGLRGQITSHWNWESAVVYSENDLEQLQRNMIFTPNLAAAVAGGYNAANAATAGGAFSRLYSNYTYNVNGSIAPGILQPALDPFSRSPSAASIANIYGTEQLNAVSQLESWDGKIVGRAAKLPAGDLGVAIGAQARREMLGGHTDPNGRNTDPVTGVFPSAATPANAQFWAGGAQTLYADPFSKARSIVGAFAETRIPITSDQWSVPVFHAFDLTAAYRFEHYSDAGNSNVPKFGFRWQPLDQQVTLRGNWAKSFYAPGLYNEYGPIDTRQVGSGVLSGAFPNAVPSVGFPFNGEDGNNPALKPATSISRSIGVVLKPNFVPHLTVTADFSDINLQGFQAGTGFNNIALSVDQLGSASPFFNRIATGNFPGFANSTNPFGAPGSLSTYLQNPSNHATGSYSNLFMVDYFGNSSDLIEESWTLALDYLVPTQSWGTFDVSSNGTILTSFKYLQLNAPANVAQLPAPVRAAYGYIQFAGAATNSAVFSGTLPKYHFYTTLDWQYGDVDFSVSNTYLSAVNDTGAAGTSAPVPVNHYFSWDARVAYSFQTDKVKSLKLAAGVNNITNRLPPLDPRTFTDNNADVSTYSPIGRLAYATIEVGL